MDLPGFSALPGFKAPSYGDEQSALNPGTTVPATIAGCAIYTWLISLPGF